MKNNYYIHVQEIKPLKDEHFVVTIIYSDLPVYYDIRFVPLFVTGSVTWSASSYFYIIKRYFLYISINWIKMEKTLKYV